jgi:hypothetical protein
LIVLWTLVEGTAEHSIFALIDEKYKPVKFFMNEIILALHWAGSNPVLFAVVLGMSYCVAVTLWTQLSPDEKPRLAIVSVWNDDPVTFQQEVSGVLADTNAPVELRVYAGNTWHRQWPVKFQGDRWRGKCQFGDAQSPAGGAYKVVAISPKGQLADKIAELPSRGVKSEVISVVRSTPAVSKEG